MLRIYGVIASFVGGIWLTWFFQSPLVRIFGYVWDPQVLGQLGDSFGALNALFAALGFAAVITTLWQQQKQIKLTQDEQHKQNFDSSYFELLKLLRETRNEVIFKKSKILYNKFGKPINTTKSGASAFKSAWFEALSFIENQNKPLSIVSVGTIYKDIIHDRFESNFGPYFRILYTILYRIDTDNVLSISEKHRYGNLLRSQLTSYELALVGLNGLSPVSKDFSDLVTKFHLLKYLPHDKRREILNRLYHSDAFKSRD